MMELAGIELGGTKTIVVRGAPGAIRDRVEFPTTNPGDTLTHAADIVAAWHAEYAIAALGIASFGPVRVDPCASDYGEILTTPKAGWSGARVRGLLRKRLGLPTAIDTDVNAAALAEYALGAAQNCATMAYVTIGTGIGCGVLVDGKPMHGILHPEIGHLRLRRVPGDRFGGHCPFHGDCIEGLISGPALAARFARHPAEVPSDDPAWQPVVADFSELLASLILSYSPQRIVIGGGVAQKQAHLRAAATAAVPRLLAAYLTDVNADRLRELVVAAGLGDDAGPTGALLLARRATGALPG
ncbi:ROK family protein [Sphingopyxis sp.]|jgi:fructokinase|uniref:ROK family protein n=1 Tax=Sphingopyxis sp. TaxID=1908224 RepID=UPI003F712DAF